MPCIMVSYLLLNTIGVSSKSFFPRQGQAVAFVIGVARHYPCHRLAIVMHAQGNNTVTMLWKSSPCFGCISQRPPKPSESRIAAQEAEPWKVQDIRKLANTNAVPMSQKNAQNACRSFWRVQVVYKVDCFPRFLRAFF